jgi:hypothetical protein
MNPLSRPSTSAAALFLVAFTATAFAQDSVSRNADAGNGLPGDALTPFSTTYQRANYVVDLVPFQTSWGTTFALGPILKCGKVTPARFTALSGPSVISATLRNNAPYPAASYARWTQPQGGIDPTNNLPALNTSVPRSGLATVFGVACLEYSDAQLNSTLAFLNEVIGCQVAFDPAEPGRLYVTRVVAACNSSGGTILDRSQFGLGSVDASGNVHFRADSLTASSSTNLLAGENYFRVNLPLRNTVINLIDSAGSAQPAATVRLLNNGLVTTNTPTAIPADLASRPVLIGANLAGQLYAETAVNTLTTTTAHRPGTTDQRGNPSFAPHVLFGGTVGTGAMVSKVGSTRNDSISLFGLDASGAVAGTRLLTLPSSVSDLCSGAAWPQGEDFASVDFRNYESQVTFRGGNGPVAVGKDLAGRALVAAVAYSRQSNTSAANPHDAILVARFESPFATSPALWTAAAWSSTTTADGKDILGDYGADGIPGTNDAGEGDSVVDATPIGRIASYSELSFGKDGPSLSAPMIDAAGNLWFTASVALNTLVNNQPATEYTAALLRAVDVGSSLCYRLELVLKLNDSFLGANSAKRFKIAHLGLADADSIASEAPWSASIAGTAWNNQSLIGLNPQSPKSLGGLVLSSRIIYDVDGDNDFEDPTRPGGNYNSIDEGYDVVLYLGNIDISNPCPADLDNDGDFANGGQRDGGIDVSDLLYFLAGFELGAPAIDLDNGSGTGTPDGGVDISDLVYFLVRFEGGC